MKTLVRVWWETVSPFDDEGHDTYTHLAFANVERWTEDDRDLGYTIAYGKTFCGVPFQHPVIGQGRRRVCLRCRKHWQAHKDDYKLQVEFQRLFPNPNPRA